MPPAPTRQQDTKKAIDHSARTAAVSRAFGTLRPEHLHLALEALGLQHLQSLAGQMDQGLQGMQPGQPPQPTGEPQSPSQPLPGGIIDPQAQQNETNVYKTMLNDNLPDRQMQRQAMMQEQASQLMADEKNQQLKNFLSGMQGTGFSQMDRSMMTNVDPLSPFNGTGVHR